MSTKGKINFLQIGRFGTLTEQTYRNQFEKRLTFGLGRFWTGVAGSPKIGLDLFGFVVVDIVNNTSLHLKTWQNKIGLRPMGTKANHSQWQAIKHCVITP